MARMSPRFVAGSFSLFCKDVGRLADGAYYVVGLTFGLRSEVVYLVVGLIECRAHKVVHACVYNDKLLACTTFDICDA